MAALGSPGLLTQEAPQHAASVAALQARCYHRGRLCKTPCFSSTSGQPDVASDCPEVEAAHSVMQGLHLQHHCAIWVRLVQQPLSMQLEWLQVRCSYRCMLCKTARSSAASKQPEMASGCFKIAMARDALQGLHLQQQPAQCQATDATGDTAAVCRTSKLQP